MKTTIPKASILENNKSVIIYAEMPGVDKKDLDVKVDGEMLTIHGKASYPVKEELVAIHKEFNDIETYQRQFILTNKINRNSINAKLEDGLLKISLDKNKEEQTKKITVN